MHDNFFFVRDWVVKDALCYLKNEQLNPPPPPISVIYSKGEKEK